MRHIKKAVRNSAPPVSDNLLDSLAGLAAAMNQLRNNPTSFGSINSFLMMGTINGISGFLSTITDLPPIVNATLSALSNDYIQYIKTVVIASGTPSEALLANLTGLSISLVEFSSSIVLTPAQFTVGIQQLLITNLEAILGATTATQEVIMALGGLLLLTNLDCFEGALDPNTGIRAIINSAVNTLDDAIPSLLFQPGFNLEALYGIQEAALQVLALYL